MRTVLRSNIITIDFPNTSTTWSTSAWEKLFGRIEPVTGDQPDTRIQPQAIQARYFKQSLHRQGGIGRIWIAHDSNLNRAVALKDLQPQYTEDPAVRERFVREAQITGKLDHPNIVPVYQLRQGSDVTEPFYTMRLVEGKTLRELISHHHQDPKRRDQAQPAQHPQYRLPDDCLRTQPGSHSPRLETRQYRGW